jgi:hypothetical protein
MSDVGQSVATDSCTVSYFDHIEQRRKVEHWPTPREAYDRYYVLINTAFAGMVRLGEATIMARGD